MDTPRCDDFSWDDLDEEARDHRGFAIGDVVWNPKDPGAHVLVDTEERTYGWVTVPVLLCQCGHVDMEDHHVFTLRREVFLNATRV